MTYATIYRGTAGGQATRTLATGVRVAGKATTVRDVRFHIVKNGDFKNEIGA